VSRLSKVFLIALGGLVIASIIYPDLWAIVFGALFGAVAIGSSRVVADNRRASESAQRVVDDVADVAGQSDDIRDTIRELDGNISELGDSVDAVTELRQDTTELRERITDLDEKVRERLTRYKDGC
jgi:methyl-accepting chemotaxis protein